MCRYKKNNVKPPLFFNLIFNEEKIVDSVRDEDEDRSVQKSKSDPMILQEFLLMPHYRPPFHFFECLNISGCLSEKHNRGSF